MSPVVEKLVQDFPSLRELRRQPTQFSSVMRAACDGAVDYDELDELVDSVAGYIDDYIEAHPPERTPGKINIQPTWRGITSRLDLSLLEDNADMQASLLHMGQVADEVARLIEQERVQGN